MPNPVDLTEINVMLAARGFFFACGYFFFAFLHLDKNQHSLVGKGSFEKNKLPH